MKYFKLEFSFNQLRNQDIIKCIWCLVNSEWIWKENLVWEIPMKKTYLNKFLKDFILEEYKNSPCASGEPNGSSYPQRWPAIDGPQEWLIHAFWVVRIDWRQWIVFLLDWNELTLIHRLFKKASMTLDQILGAKPHSRR